MGKKIIRVTDNRKEAVKEMMRVNRNLRQRKIKREAYLTPISQSYVKKLTRKGYPIPKKNYAIAIRNKKR